MRNKLLISVAMTALIGSTALAAAQNAQEGQPGKATPAPGAAQQHQTAPGGAMNHPQPSGQMAPGGAAQNKEPSSENKSFSQENKETAPQRGAQSTPEQRGGQGGAQEQRSGQNEQSGRAGGANVQISEQQRTQIKSVIVKDRNVARVDNVNFNIRVGVAVPRTVHVAVLPPEVITIVPEYRGFDYVVVGDQLLIIDPNTMLIVAVLPA